MVRGLFTAASGMNVQQNRLDEIANNLANVDLNGYKKDTAIQKAFPEMLMRRMNDDGMYKFPVRLRGHGAHRGDPGNRRGDK